MDSKTEELWSQEKQHWFDGASFYERELAPGAAMVIPYPAGLQDRADALEGLKPARQWEAIELYDQNVTRKGDTVLLSYRVVAWRDCCSAPLRARCASTYLDDDGRWLRLSHEREPIQDPASKVAILRRPDRNAARLGAA
ncbi:hypothetical protein FHS00_000524 [Limimaricola variabilis]|uniref:DUF4440 domain-containing protein n=1 Tax=Limimaricola variabilis TaxID=1492771 RepID=A0ABR6HK92_9RHOB|nr:DUF4440 domain-containing protein [Limimaricola variabilis]MBB3710971.1 hypothetical protein [Limimaricola variabilis]